MVVAHPVRNLLYGNTVTCKITVDGTNVESITPIGVIKNIYKVNIPTSATGLSISGGGIKYVIHGNSVSFSVTKQTGYTQATPVVKVNGAQIGGVLSGDTYNYTISGITGNKTVTVDNAAVNTYSVGYDLGSGVSKASGTATSISHFGEATVSITVDSAHNQNAPAPTVSNGTITYDSRSGDTYNYTLSGVTANTTVTVGNIKRNIYTVNIPEGEGYSLDRKSMNIEHGDNFDFTVTLDAAHSQTPPRAFLAGNELSYTRVGENGYKFNTGAVYAHGDVTISNIKINTYSIELPADTDAFKAADKDGFNSTSITHGNDYTFTVTVDKAYTQTEPYVTLKDGTVLTADSNVTDGEGNIVYTYTVENVTDHNKISVAEMSKNTYSAVLPFDKTAEASYKVTNENADSNNVVSGIVYGTDLTFGIDLAKQYNRSNVVVKYKGTVLTPTAGVYTIKNVTGNIVDGDIVVEGVELNHYYITLPLETETGFTIIVGEGLNAKSVLSGSDFDFKFFLDPAYSDSKPVIKYSADGGNNYKVLTEEDGKYTIENVLSDCIVVVEGVKKNTYTVNFNNEDGTLIKAYPDVEYGAEVVFDGTEPTKASEPVKEYTDENGNEVVVTKEYTFAGWSADTKKVVSDMDITPIFEVSEVTTTKPAGGGDPTVIVTSMSANVLFVSDGVIIHKETVTKGESFSGWNGVPVKTSSNPYETYTFIGWDTDRDGVVDFAAGDSNAIADVQNDVTFTAVFESNLPSQTVNFYNFDGSELLYSASVKRGEKAEYGLSGSPEIPALRG